MDAALALREKNIKPSMIRVMIYEYLKNSTSHPTADDIFRKLSLEIPTLSKTSVYNTVKLLSDSGLVLSLTIDSEHTRYDAYTNIHGHFICDNCRRVYDFPIDNMQLDMLKDFDIKYKNVYFSGICKECLK